MRRVLSIIFAVGLSVSAFGQAPTGTLSGKVTDQTGAVIPQATVTVTGPDGKQTTAITGAEGGFEVRTLTPGSYSVAAGAKGFAPFRKDGITLTAGQTQTLNIPLEIQTKEEKVEVESEGTQLDVSSSSNAGSVVLKGKDLEALSDDPDELQSELQALAGPAAGPNGGQIYIDGFTGGQLPPKAAIREIRVNQNPFSAQYDKLGYGRIEILTKPGSDKFHGQIFFNDNNSIFNSRNPYVLTKPSYNSEMFDGSLGGPITKKTSFFLNAQRRNINEFSAINATIPGPDPNGVQFQDSIANPRTRTNISPRLDYQISGSNTLTARYQLTHETNQNSGLTQFSLPSQAYNLNETEHTLQISDSQILSPKIVNETRFQFQRETNHQLPLSAATAVQVQGFFSNGGNTQGQVRSTQNNYELQNYTSISHGNHLIKFGGRLRVLTIANSSNPNFNGTFIFSPVFSNTGQLLATALQTYESASASAQNCSSSNYVAASCPSQFSITAGVPMVSVNWFDAGLYAEDEWRVRPNLSLTYGLRFESQNNIHDHADFAPRLGIAWGVGSDGRSAPKTVVRAGFGIFYDRFGQNLVQQAERLNGVTQQSIVVRNPEFYSTVPSFSQLQALSNAAPTVYQISPNLRAPYTIQSAASIERQITKAATLSLTYLNSRGEHALYIRNVSAPGAYPVFPQYANENVYQYQSEGVFRQNQFIANVRVSAGKKLSLFGFYTLSYANSNVSAGGGGGGFFGSGTTSSASFLSDQNDPMADYGRAAFDVRHRAFIGGNISLPHSFSLSPFIIINSGQPYNITTGTDLNGDSIFNDRPALASATPCPTYTRVANSTDICTPLGTFNTVPAGQAILPINYGTGPGNATFNLRLSKTIGFGPEAKGASAGRDGGSGGGPRGGGLPGGGLGGRGLSGAGGANPFGFGGTTNRRYNLTFSVSARNLLNSANPGAPVGNLSSQLFAQSISIAGGPFSSASANRRVDLQVMFSF